MKYVIFLTVLLTPLTSQAVNLHTWWQGFCQRNLVADDPTQYEGLDVDTLVWIYFKYGASNALVKEMEKRLRVEDLPRDDREILNKTLENKK